MLHLPQRQATFFLYPCTMSSAFNTMAGLFRRIMRVWLYTSVAVLSTVMLLSFTSVPFWGLYRLSRPGADFNFTPEAIVMMGGGGMPGRTALMRSYFTAKMALTYPEALVVIALPDDTSLTDSHLRRVKAELVMRGVQPQRIVYEHEGTNTRAQALNVGALLPRQERTALLVVTDPEHVYRTVACFRKVGFESIGSVASFEVDLDASLRYTTKDLGGKGYVPDVGSQNNLRYQFWNHLIYQILLFREYTAIAYYKMQGWI